jgi:predicted rRNA methylase YqxC with S4 and FtsJ domains
MALTVYTRLDKYLALNGYAGNSESARGLIEGGKVMINGQIITHPAFPMSDTFKFKLQIITKDFSLGSINRLKLDFAFGAFKIDIKDQHILAICAPNSGYDEAFKALGAASVSDTESAKFLFCDIAHIGLRRALAPHMATAKSLLASIKPQYELESDTPVNDPVQQRLACSRIETWLKESGWQIKGFTPNPADAVDGNREFFVYALKA